MIKKTKVYSDQKFWMIHLADKRLFSAFKVLKEKASIIHQDYISIILSVSRLAKNGERSLKKSRILLLSRVLKWNTYMTKSRWENEYDRINTTTNINN